MVSAYPGLKDLKKRRIAALTRDTLSASLFVVVKLSREAFHCVADDPANKFIGNAYSLAAVELKTHFKDGARICNAIDTFGA